VVWVEVLEGVAQVRSLAWPQHEGRLEAEGLWADPGHMDARLQQPVLEVVSLVGLAAVEAEVGAVAADVLDPAVVAGDIIQFNFEEAASVVHKLKQSSVLDFLPGNTEVHYIHQVDILVEIATHWVHSVVQCAVEAGETRVSAESHDVGAAAILLTQVPVFVRPHFCTSAHADFSLVHDEWNALPRCELSKFFVVGWRGLHVGKAGNRLHNNGTDVLASSTLIVDDLSCGINASLFFISIRLGVLNEWLDHVGQWCLWPVESWKTLIENWV